MAISSFFHRRSIKTIFRSTLRYFFGAQGQRRIRGWRLFFRMRIELLLRSKDYIGKLARRTEVYLWVDGSEAYPRMEKLIRRAEHTIIIQTFIWKDDQTGRRIASALVDAANRGVKVEITKEATGDAFELDRDFATTASEKTGVWKLFWSHPNIRIRHTKEFNHAKVTIIDNVILLLAGMNIADDYLEWRDYMVELRGSRFVDRFLTEGELHDGGPVRLVLNTERRKEIRPTLRHILETAKESILLEQCYIADPEIVSLLARRSREGVRVTLIIPKRADIHHHANMQSVEQLLLEGDREHLRVLLYPKVIHGKVILVDKNCVFVGSANLMTSSLDMMGEVNVLIYGKRRRALHKLREVIRRDILKSEPLLSPPKLWWIGRLLAWLQL